MVVCASIKYVSNQIYIDETMVHSMSSPIYLPLFLAVKHRFLIKVNRCMFKPLLMLQNFVLLIRFHRLATSIAYGLFLSSSPSLQRAFLK